MLVAIMTAAQFQKVARALADSQRLAILERIAREPGESRREAQCVFLSLRRRTMEAYRQELGRRMALDS
jgi:hypothetical protein